MEPEVHYKLRQLARTFTSSQAREVGVSDRLLYELRDEKSIETIGWGLFRKITVSKRGVDFELLEIAKRAKGATICLASALALFSLADPLPVWDIALRRDSYRPRLETPVRWHSFDTPTFHLGRIERQVEKGVYIGIYLPERSIIDALRTRRSHDHALAVTAIKRWLGQEGNAEDRLLELAASFPRVEARLRRVLEVLRT